MINQSYINNFNQRIDGISNREELKGFLIETRKARIESGKHNHFWNFNQNKLHQKFDSLYAQGLKKLANEEVSSLSKNITTYLSEKPFLPSTEKMIKAAGIGLSAAVGVGAARVYTESMTNLIIHENGHKWAMQAIHQNVEVEVSSNALYWIEKGEWSNWLLGVREGAPGNWAMITNSWKPTLSEFGKSLTLEERKLIISGSGLGAEVLFNTSVAALGILAIKKKRPLLGVLLLSFGISATIFSHNFYNGRHSSLLSNWKSGLGEDPPQIAEYLAKILNCQPSDAFRLFYHGFLALPFTILGVLSALLIKKPEDVTDETALMRLINEKYMSSEIKMVLAEVEIEMADQLTKILPDSPEYPKLIEKITKKVLTKVKSDTAAKGVFKQAKKDISIELNGKVSLVNSISSKIRTTANVVASLASQMRNLDLLVIPKMAHVFSILSYVSVGAQGVSTILDCIQTIQDMNNDKLDKAQKAISIAKLILSVASVSIIALAILIPGVNAVVIPFILTTTLLRLMLFSVDVIHTRKLAMQKPVV